ncbi:hypothetical protein WQ57_05760 [Mesobacillus campisalis]|uniref:Uncharacterized protein n=1 Tax=Mesobacillus campisalis TaxID=1408103 RepID=A0A0M2T0V2_9BACI|nr:hypothetical protein [Mesobacillus campisalis]KKK38857.1 hypothetical protein WQ57_05760 [Mesobacillus campisalis]
MDYHILFYGGMAGALVALILAVFLYIKLNIPQVMKDLTGISLPGAARIASRQKFAEAEQTGRITNEIKLRKDVDVSAAERTLTMENQQKHTSTHNLGQGSAAMTRPSAVQPAAALAATSLLTPGEKKEAGDTVLLEHAGGMESNEAEETTLLQGIQAGLQRPAASHVEETTLLQDSQGDRVQPGAPLVEETALLYDSSKVERVEETVLLDGSFNSENAAETALLQETELLNETSSHHEPAETALLSDIEETELLTPAAETALLTDIEETMPLSPTTVLTPIEETTLLAAAALEEEQELYFKKEVDIIVVHTTTII